MSKQQIDELIQFLTKYELSIATLYETFASVLPESKNDWMAFADQERIHAKWINKLYTYLKDGKISSEQTNFTVQSAKTAIGYIETQIDRTVKEKINLTQSLNIAINIEKSLIESAFFTVFKLSSPEAQKIQLRLEEATKSHIDRLMAWRKSIEKA